MSRELRSVDGDRRPDEPPADIGRSQQDRRAIGQAALCGDPAEHFEHEALADGVVEAAIRHEGLPRESLRGIQIALDERGEAERPQRVRPHPRLVHGLGVGERVPRGAGRLGLAEVAQRRGELELREECLLGVSALLRGADRRFELAHGIPRPAGEHRMRPAPAVDLDADRGLPIRREQGARHLAVRLVESRRRFVEVALQQAQPGGVDESRNAVGGGASRQGEHARRPAAPLGEEPADRPVVAQVREQGEGDVGVDRGGHGESGLQFCPVRTQLREDRGLPGAVPIHARTRRDGREVVEVTPCQGGRPPLLLGALPSVTADRLEHPEATGLVVRLDDGLRDEFVEGIDDGVDRVAADCGSGPEVERAGEHRERAPELALFGRAQLVAPVDHRPEGALAPDGAAGAAAKEREPGGQPARELGDRERPQPRRGELDRERQPVEGSAQVDRGFRVRLAEFEGGVGGTRSGDQERHRLGRPVRGGHHRQRGHRVDQFAVELERTTARREHRELRESEQQFVGERRGGIDDLLAVVDDQDGGRAAKRGDDDLERIARRLFGERKGTHHREGQTQRVLHGLERDEPAVDALALRIAVRRAHREPGLACTADARQRDQRRRIEKRFESLQLAMATDERASRLSDHHDSRRPRPSRARVHSGGSIIAVFGTAARIGDI